MQWTPVMLASLAVTAALGGAGSGMVLASPMAEPTVDPGHTPVPLERLVIAVLDAGVSASAAPALASDDALASRLHLADPVATVVVMRSGDPEQTIGPFRVSITSPSATAAAVRVETADGASSLVDLPVVAADHVAVVEVLGGPEGVVAQRVGDLLPVPDELLLPAWQPPAQGMDAVALDGAWWTLEPDVVAPDTTPSPAAGRALRQRVAHASPSRLRRLVDASVGDVTGDGVPDLALSFRRPFRQTLINVSRPRREWADARGQSAHVGLFRPSDLSSIWVAGTLLRPVRRLAACTGALAVAYSTLRRPEVVAATVWDWQGFGFLPLPELPGPGRPTCIDIDRDGRPDAAIVERS